MVRRIIFGREFDRLFENFLKKRKILEIDFEKFCNELLQNPELGDIVVGLHGIRKVRLKSSSKGKSGGFRICYYYLTVDDEIFLLYIYAKNDQTDLNSEAKRTLKEYVRFLKGETYE